jgi:hypothetical protein
MVTNFYNPDGLLTQSASGARIIFIEKRISSTASLKMLCIFDLSFGYAMFFSRRWLLCACKGLRE